MVGCRGISVIEDSLGTSTVFLIGASIGVVLGDGLGDILEVVGGTTIFDFDLGNWRRCVSFRRNIYNIIGFRLRFGGSLSAIKGREREGDGFGVDFTFPGGFEIVDLTEGVLN